MDILSGRNREGTSPLAAEEAQDVIESSEQCSSDSALRKRVCLCDLGNPFRTETVSHFSRISGIYRWLGSKTWVVTEVGDGAIKGHG